MKQYTPNRAGAVLPPILPLFPLTGGVLLPRGRLPLNIFEPRYLKLVDDVLAGERLIGMVQPRFDEDGTELFDIGCAGRITAFTETDDSHYLITLTGVSRFKILEEVAHHTPYRQARIDWETFEADLSPSRPDDTPDRKELLEILHDYLESQEFDADWESIESASSETLVNSLSMIFPFEPQEKQALLEARGLRARADMLVAIMEMALASGDEEAGPAIQ